MQARLDIAANINLKRAHRELAVIEGVRTNYTVSFQQGFTELSITEMIRPGPSNAKSISRIFNVGRQSLLYAQEASAFGIVTALKFFLWRGRDQDGRSTGVDRGGAPLALSGRGTGAAAAGGVP